MSSDNSLNDKTRWYFYLSDKGILVTISNLLKFPVIRYTSALGVIIAFLWLLDVVRRPFAPSDWVEVTVKNVPKGLRQIYLIADNRDGVRALNWYFSKLFVWAGNPIDLGEAWDFGPENKRSGSLQWLVAVRYGALAQRADGKWEL